MQQIMLICFILFARINYRSTLINKLKENGFHAVFHYLSLHSSDFYKDKHDDRILSNSDRFSDCLVRLPMFYELDFKTIESIVDIIKGIN